jgi:tetratricopeptide (TPR) repeat protein
MKPPSSRLPSARAARRRGAFAFEPAAIGSALNAAAVEYAAGRLEEAARLYRRLETADPGDIRARYSLAVIDIRQGRMQSARRRLLAVLALQPDLFEAQQNLGVACQRLGLWSEAAAAYRRAWTLRPAAAESGFSLTRALVVLGRSGEAIETYRELAADPASRWRALTRLGVLSPEAVSDDELSDLDRAARDPAIDADTRIGLFFALGAVLDQRRADDEAFEAFAAGNRLKHQSLAEGIGATTPESVARGHAETIDFMRGVFTADLFARRRGGGGSAAPIFIVGMPRSGSSLIEQILTSHPKVQGMGESGALPSQIDEFLKRVPHPPGDPADWRRLADGYLAAMRARGWSNAPRFVDKTLENYLRIGMIHLMFPRAVILHAVRDPVDTCLACFRQLFASGNETLYDLRQIGETYVEYRRMMEHWRTVLPGRVVDVDHEALVGDPEGRIRWLVTEACGLEWDPACLNFHRTEATVRTSSHTQVRQPIFQTSLQRWRRYERHLGPLLKALGPYAPDVGGR